MVIVFIVLLAWRVGGLTVSDWLYAVTSAG